MPKKFGVNTKKQEAKERELNKKKEAKETEERQKENEYWKETDDKIIKKKEKEREKEREKQEKLRKKQEAKELLDQEEKEMLEGESKYKLKPPSKREIAKFEEDTKKELLTQHEDQKDNVINQAEEFDVNEDYVNENYSKLENKTSKGLEIIDVRGIDNALDELGLQDEDNHPEKRMKQAWENYFESELPRIQQEHPHLKRSQYINMLQKEFKTSTKNPVYMKTAKDAKKKDKDL